MNEAIDLFIAFLTKAGGLKKYVAFAENAPTSHLVASASVQPRMSTLFVLLRLNQPLQCPVAVSPVVSHVPHNLVPEYFRNF